MQFYRHVSWVQILIKMLCQRFHPRPWLVVERWATDIEIVGDDKQAPSSVRERENAGQSPCQIMAKPHVRKVQNLPYFPLDPNWNLYRFHLSSTFQFIFHCQFQFQFQFQF